MEFNKTWLSIFPLKELTISTIIARPLNNFSRNQPDRFRQVKCLLRSFAPTQLTFNWQPLPKTACSGLKKLLPINWQHNAMQTLRHKLIHHGASVSFKKQICTLRLNASYRYKTEVEAIYQNLTQEIEFAKLAKHQALDKFRK